MKKETIILIGLGAVALYFVIQKRRRGQVFVENPRKISEEEFETPTTDERQIIPIEQKARGVIDVVKDVFKTDSSKRKERKEARTQKRTTRQAQKVVRQQKRAESRIRRKEQRKAKRQKVGDISIMY